MNTQDDETKAKENPLIVENDDGSITVKFPEKRKPKVDGTAVSELTMRELTVADMLVGRAQGKSDNAETEICTIAMLMELAPDTLKAFSVRHYGRLQEAFALFHD